MEQKNNNLAEGILEIANNNMSLCDETKYKYLAVEFWFESDNGGRYIDTITGYDTSAFQIFQDPTNYQEDTKYLLNEEFDGDWSDPETRFKIHFDLNGVDNDGKELIACASDSLFKTVDGGNSWTAFATKPENDNYMKDLIVDWETRSLYVSIYNPSNGVYKLYF